jgi:hypothetical protein
MVSLIEGNSEPTCRDTSEVTAREASAALAGKASGISNQGLEGSSSRADVGLSKSEVNIGWT